MGKYYRKAILYPALALFLMDWLHGVLIGVSTHNWTYIKEGFIIMTVLYTLQYSLIVGVLSTSIFMVEWPRIQKSTALTILCWFLLPVCFMLLFPVYAYYNMRFFHRDSYSDEIMILALLNLPFLVGLIWTYLIYRKKSRVGNVLSAE